MMTFILTLWNLWFAHEHDGQGLVEYALVVVLVSVTAASLLGVVGGNVNDLYFSRIVNSVTR
jgi:Flp pilus assembly pilin Flp